MRESLGSRLGWAAFQVVIVGLVWWFMIRSDALAIGLIATIVVSAVVAPRWSNVVSGVGLIATAAALNIVHGLTQVPLLLCAIGIVLLGVGAREVWTTRRMRGDINATS